MIVEFWNTREPRERLLLGVALALSLALAVYQFLWTPALSFQSKAKRDYANAQSDFSLVQQSVGSLNGPVNTTGSQAPLQSVVVDVAGVYGLTISRIEPASDGGLNLWFEAESPNGLFAWLSDLHANHGVFVGKASMRTVQNGEAVSANLYVNRGR